MDDVLQGALWQHPDHRVGVELQAAEQGSGSQQQAAAGLAGGMHTHDLGWLPAGWPRLLMQGNQPKAIRPCWRWCTWRETPTPPPPSVPGAKEFMSHTCKGGGGYVWPRHTVWQRQKQPLAASVPVPTSAAPLHSPPVPPVRAQQSRRTVASRRPGPPGPAPARLGAVWGLARALAGGTALARSRLGRRHSSCRVLGEGRDSCGPELTETLLSLHCVWHAQSRNKCKAWANG